MAYCAGCGSFVGDYSAYRRRVGGKDEQVLCYRCNRWLDRHPGTAAFPPVGLRLAPEGGRLRIFSKIYIITAFGVFALGVMLTLTTGWLGPGILLILGGLSLFFFGVGMKRFLGK